MQVTTHGGNGIVAPLSKTVSHIEQREVGALRSVETLERNDGIGLFGRIGPVFDPLSIDAVDIINDTNRFDAVLLLELLHLGGDVFW